ncbi:MBL fold metallo-hydrolase [Desertimonas flava]|uniref:MBL fold metallo-hydrolase n=1 Tax=Desertimonas flava TaxID=2064846 RepID=UPI000E354C0D|nr:MBL fold metallo-hydrolase [Desertimonas flava]
MRLLPEVTLVASGWLGCSLSDPHDCHVYLVADPDGGDAYLVDAGCGLGTDATLQAIDRAGVDRRRIGRILLTHGHADHAAGAADLADALGAEIWAAPETAAIVETADHAASGLDDAKAAGVYPDEVVFRTHPAVTIGDGARFDGGGAMVTAHLTPGHSAGHLCFSTELSGRRVLFSGDLVFARGRVAILDTPDTDVEALAASIGLVADLAPDALLAGHGEHVLGSATSHLLAARDAFAGGGTPAGLVP